jgi:protocatechuate 3,4-dioxygenase beta subunit
MKMKSNIFGQNKSAQRKFLIIFSLFLFSPILSSNSILAENSYMVAQLKKYSIGCTPTPPDALGPFYKPKAPLRSSVGKGYELSGRAMSSRDCSPIPQARIELWMVGPDGDYKDAYRATAIPDESGEYRFESHVPPSYLRRPPHIHMRITADGFKTLITQHYPEDGSKKGTLDLVLIPQ